MFIYTNMDAPKFSFEFFPPRNEQQQRRFWTAFGSLQTLNPDYISMTWGALGTTSQVSLDVLEALSIDTTVPVAAHLTCVGQNDQSVRQTIGKLSDLGITRFVALRGDAEKTHRQPDSLQHAIELVAILAEDERRDISVAAYPEVHPESANADLDIYWLREKLNAGAKRAITQFFFEAETFLRFRDRATKAGIHQTLVPGILPIHDIAKVLKFSSQCGASVPAKLVERFSETSDAKARRELAIEYSARLCQALQREGVGEFHIYTLNQADLSYQLVKNLQGERSGVVAAA